MEHRESAMNPRPTGARGATPWSLRTHDMEHRWGRRIACHARVRLSAGIASDVPGQIRDVSISGAFVETTLKPPMFAIVEITVRRDDGLEETTLCGSVVRKEHDGIAVEWSEALVGPLCPLLGCASHCQAARDAGY